MKNKFRVCVLFTEGLEERDSRGSGICHLLHFLHISEPINHTTERPIYAQQLPLALLRTWQKSLQKYFPKRKKYNPTEKLLHFADPYLSTGILEMLVSC